MRSHIVQSPLLRRTAHSRRSYHFYGVVFLPSGTESVPPASGGSGGAPSLAQYRWLKLAMAGENTVVSLFFH